MYYYPAKVMESHILTYISDNPIIIIGYFPDYMVNPAKYLGPSCHTFSKIKIKQLYCTEGVTKHWESS